MQKEVISYKTYFLKKVEQPTEKERRVLEQLDKLKRLQEESAKKLSQLESALYYKFLQERKLLKGES